MKCPGDCNNAGVCDSTTGKCTCHTGRNGEDCSSKYQIKRFIENNRHYKSFPFIFHPLDFDCPADGLCSNQGKCNDSIGICICDQGYEGINCEGNFRKIEILALWKIYA